MLLFAGGRAEYGRAPKGDFNLLHVHSGMPDEKVSYLSGIFSTSYRCVIHTGITKGVTVGVTIRIRLIGNISISSLAEQSLPKAESAGTSSHCKTWRAAFHPLLR